MTPHKWVKWGVGGEGVGRELEERQILQQRKQCGTEAWARKRSVSFWDWEEDNMELPRRQQELGSRWGASPGKGQIRQGHMRQCSIFTVYPVYKRTCIEVFYFLSRNILWLKFFIWKLDRSKIGVHEVRPIKGLLP